MRKISDKTQIRGQATRKNEGKNRQPFLDTIDLDIKKENSTFVHHLRTTTVTPSKQKIPRRAKFQTPKKIISQKQASRKKQKFNLFFLLASIQMGEEEQCTVFKVQTSLVGNTTTSTTGVPVSTVSAASEYVNSAL